MKRILMSTMILLALGIMACQKDKPTTGGGGGDNTATISGTVDIDGVTLTIYDGLPTGGKELWGPTVIGKSYSAKFNVKDGRTGAFMLFSKSGCNNGAISVDVRPGTNINVGPTGLLCG